MMPISMFLIATPDGSQYRIAGNAGHQGRLLADQHIAITVAGRTFSEILWEVNGLIKIDMSVPKADLDNDLRTMVVYRESRTPYDQEREITSRGMFFENCDRPGELIHNGLVS